MHVANGMSQKDQCLLMKHYVMKWWPVYTSRLCFSAF